MRIVATIAIIWSSMWFGTPSSGQSVRTDSDKQEADGKLQSMFATVPIFDAHCHYAGEHPSVRAWMSRHDVKVLNIAVGRADVDWRKYATLFSNLASQHPDQFAWCTSITPPDFKTADYADRTIRQLEADFANGAVACKIAKNIGMRVQRPNGQYVQIDDPIFEPILKWLADRGHTLIAHIAEPIACWQPLDEKNPYRHYYSKHPEWHMYGRLDRPHHSEIIAARDRITAKYPTLRVVGAHLGSLEYDVDELATRFDEYPNFAVDTSGRSRIGDLGRQDREKVRSFFIKYQDRIMFGSDRSARGQLQMEPAELKASLAKLADALQLGWDYYATDKVVMVNGQSCHGLSLPDDVLEKLFSNNAQRWFPQLGDVESSR